MVSEDFRDCALSTGSIPCLKDKVSIRRLRITHRFLLLPQRRSKDPETARYPQVPSLALRDEVRIRISPLQNSIHCGTQGHIHCGTQVLT